MKKAVILFNLGGPDSLNSVEPFLFNLFNDPSILSLQSLIRYPLAKLISKRRAPVAKAKNKNNSRRYFSQKSCSREYPKNQKSNQTEFNI